MIDSEQLVLEGVQEQEAYQRFQAEVAKRQFGYTTRFPVHNLLRSNFAESVVVSPGNTPVIEYFDRTCKQYLARSAYGVEIVRQDEDYETYRTNSNVSRINEFTEILTMSVPEYDSPDIAQRVHAIFNLVESKLAVRHEPKTALKAKYDDKFGNANCVDISIGNGNEGGTSRLTIVTNDFSGSTVLKVDRNCNGSLTINAETFLPNDSAEDNYIGEVGVVLSHADLDVLEHIIFCSQIRTPHVVQEVRARSKTIGRRILEHALNR